MEPQDSKDTEPKNSISSQDKPDIERCFHTNRFPRLPWCLLLLIYAPLGLFLTLLRVCMSLQALLILALFPEGAVKRFLLRVFFGVLGIVVVRDSCHRKSSQTKVFICNKVSHIDHIVLHLALDCITLSTGGTAAPVFHFLFPHRKLSSTSPEDLESEAKQLPEFDGNGSFVVQPEPMPTNGSHSLLKFNDWPCSIASNIQPIALTARRPFGIKLTTVHSSQWWDLFWTLFLPATIFRVKVLAPMERREGEEVSELSERVRESLGEELNLQRSEYTMDDVKEWLEACKKKVLEASSTITTTTTPVSCPVPRVDDDGLERKVEQVSAVMPQVPCHAIRRDLLRTQSVDATISNLLEGVVAYDPLPPVPITHSSSSSPSPSPHITHTTTIPSLKSTNLRPRKYYSPAMEAMHRQLSLEERKTELLNNARKQFIEKHGLSLNG